MHRDGRASQYLDKVVSSSIHVVDVSNKNPQVNYIMQKTIPPLMQSTADLGWEYQTIYLGHLTIFDHLTEWYFI